mgnify:CR=1 FL=1
MKIVVDRKWKKSEYTIGRLYIDGEFFCNTLEDPDRGLDEKMDIREIRAKKIPNQTAIPTGTYNITLDVKSPKFSTYNFYDEVCDGYLPRLLNVPGFDGILIHVGSNASHSSGCILVGNNTVKGGLTNSKDVFRKLYSILKTAWNNNEEIEIEIY